MVKKARTLISELGLLNSFLYVLHSFLGKVTKGSFRIIRYYLFCQPVPIFPLLSERRGANIKIVEVTEMDTHLFADFPRPEQTIKNRFSRGGKCFSAYINNCFSGFIWLSLVPYREDEVRCIFSFQPESETAWDYDVYICPQARIGFTFPKLWQTANTYLQENGVKWTFSRISAFNSGSLQSHKRLGGKKTGSATFICLGRAELMFASSSPYVSISLSENSAPNILLTVGN